MLSTAAASAIAETPTLHLEYTDRQHKSSRVESQSIRVPSTDRIRLTVILSPLPSGAGGIGGEMLELRAENHAPGYFENRPPPSLRFVVQRVDGKTLREVPFKITDSGGGLDLGKLYREVDIDIAGDLALRRAKFREYAVQIWQAKPPDPAAIGC